MLFRIIYMFFAVYVSIIVEGFFIERFLNICRNKKIYLQELHRENSTYIKAKILKSDFREIAYIAKKTKCKVKIEKKSGVPFFISKYRKRKVFAVAILVIAIFIFTMTKFIWNIEVNGNEKISSEEVVNLVNEYGIKIGKFKSNIDTEKISTLIRLKREDLSWIGITIKGTNAIITVEETTEKPEIIDKNEICNIVATKDAVISKLVVQNGTPRVVEGDTVKAGDILVEGVMEGEHTGIRQVRAEANVFGKNCYEKEKKEEFVQNETVKTGNEEKKREICINKFKINFNKGVSKFENYDTIITSRKVKFFSNFYLPIEIKKITNVEIINQPRTYSEEELKIKIEKEIDEELEKEYQISKYEDKYKKRDVEVNPENNGLKVKVIYEIQEDIGIKKNID